MVRSNIPSAPGNESLSGLTATAGELNDLDNVTDGVTSASKALVAGAASELDALRIDALDSGISGTAGLLEVFPSTAAKGKLSIAAVDSTGDTDTRITNAAQAGARTYTIPDALASAEFLMGANLVAVTATTDGTGTGTIADAGFIQICDVTSSVATKWIVLPSPVVGTIIVLVGGANGYEIRSSAPNTVAINGGTDTNGEVPIAASSLVVLVCVTTTLWLGLDLFGTTLASLPAAAD